MAEYKSVVVSAGSGGFGGPLTLVPTATKNKIVNINNTNLEMNQKIQKLNLNTQNYILIPKININPN